MLSKLIFFYNVIYTCDQKAEFLVLFQSLLSHDPSEITLICSKQCWVVLIKILVKYGQTQTLG